MKAFTCLFLSLLIGLSACQEATKAPTDAANNPTSNTAGAPTEQAAVPEASDAPAHSPRHFQKLRENVWFKGELGGIAVWLYLSYIEKGGNGARAYYGYKSTKGAPIELWGSYQGDQLNLAWRQDEQRERFQLTYDSNKGTLTGQWKNKGKTLDVELVAKNGPIGSTAELLAATGMVQFPQRYGFNKEALFGKYYLFPQAFFTVPNLHRLIPEVSVHFYGGDMQLQALQEPGLVIGKAKLSTGEQLLLYVQGFEEGDEPFMYRDTYLQTDAVTCLALFSANGQLKEAVALGAQGDYHLDFDWKWRSANHIEISWPYFERQSAYDGQSSARVQVDEYSYKVMVKNGRIQSTD